MAKRRQPIIPGWLWPGLIAAIPIIGIAVAAFACLWIYSPVGDGMMASLKDVASDRYLWRVVRFTFWQALLSAIFSLLPAIPLATALYRRQFPGRQMLLRLCAMTLVLPVLVAVFGLLSVYGQQGWLSQLCAWLNIDFTFTIYGLHGILLAHIFFNMPLATRLLLQSLDNVPVEQRQIAAQLGMDPWQRFRLVEWPALRRQILPAGALIFMLCFASFATVLSLGGGPQATTIELAIYQALRYEFDPQRAALLALIQLVCCFSMVVLSQRFSPSLPVGATYGMRWRDPQDYRWLKLFDILLIALAVLLLLPPLLAVMINGLNGSVISVLQQSLLWQAIATSLKIAVGSALLGVTLVTMLLWSSRQLHFQGSPQWAKRLELSAMTILAMPAIVLATGLFLLLINTTGIPSSPVILLILINAMMALPYTLKVMTNPMYDLTERYGRLNQSLGIAGWNRLKLIELPALRRPLSQALAFACVLSLGDFGVIALFGNENFLTLPYYLYSQLGAYRSDSAAVTALVLLLLCFTLFTLIERLGGHNDKA